MDRITLSNGKTYEAKYAALSVSTGEFSASVRADNAAVLLYDFTTSERISVDHEMPVYHEDFYGYTQLVNITRLGDYYALILDKEAGT
jgi:hypothetical protein